MTTLNSTVRRFHQTASLSVLAVIALAVPAAAQDTPVVNTRLVSAVYVRTIGGTEARGQLLRLGPDTLTILEQGSSRDIRLVDVTRIDVRGDSVKNGVIIGAAILAGWCAVVCPQGLDGYSSRQLPYLLAFNTALGAVVGAGIDAMHVGRTPIYQAAPVSSAHRETGVKALFSKRLRF